MTALGNGLVDVERHEERLRILEVELATEKRVGARESDMLRVKGNIASTYQSLGRLEEALSLEREIYARHVALEGVDSDMTMIALICLANTLSKLHRYEEVLGFAQDKIAVCQRVLGAEHEHTFFLRELYAVALFNIGSHEDREQAEAILADIVQKMRRVLGAHHPRTRIAEDSLRKARQRLERSS